MSVIDQIAVRRGNSSGGITTVTYDIGAAAENVILSDGTSVEAAISGGSVKLQGFGEINNIMYPAGGNPVAMYSLYNNPTYSDDYSSGNKVGIFILRCSVNALNNLSSGLRLISASDYAASKSPIKIIKNGVELLNNDISSGMTIIFLRHNTAALDGNVFEWIGDNFTPAITNGALRVM